jgi:hypothetical protein
VSGFTDNTVYLREGPLAQPRHRPDGPGDSFNEEEMPGSENPDRDLSLSRGSVVASAVEQMYSPEQIREILDLASDMAMSHLNRIVAEAISYKMEPAVFAEFARTKADDILETCVHRVVSRGKANIQSFDLLTLSPLGVVTFLDSIMSQEGGRVYRLETALRDAYETYLTTKLNA